jgi:hypothetical protein
VLGLFIGAAHLFLMLNAGVRSVAGNWWFGGVVAVARVVLLMALAMATTRIRGGGAEATPGLTVALYAGPALTIAALAFTLLRRRKLAQGAPDSDEARVATVVMRAWLAAATMDVIFLVVNLIRMSSSRP